MDGKRKRGGNHRRDDHETSESEGDGCSEQLQCSAEESGQKNQAGAAFYSDHINSVCAAMNTKVERSKSPFEMMMLKKRRETNRLSAKRCRSRRREKIQQLEEELRRLELETNTLISEKTELQATLQSEVSKANSKGGIGGCGMHQPPTHEFRRDPQNNHDQLLQLQQCSGPQVCTPMVRPPADPSTAALLSQLIPAVARFDTTPLMGTFFDNRIAGAHNGGLSVSAPINPPSLDIFALLTMLQAGQGPAASSRPTTDAQRVMPHTFTAPATTNKGSWLATNTLLQNGPTSDTFPTLPEYHGPNTEQNK